jgi:anti-sigma B factor antagonist
MIDWRNRKAENSRGSKLSLEVREVKSRGRVARDHTIPLTTEPSSGDDVAVISCSGRIVYRDEAIELSEQIVELLPCTRQLVLELSGVEAIDSAGLGELALMLTWARTLGCSIKLAAPNARVREVFELTNLASVFEIHSTLEAALIGFRAQAA